MSHPLLNEALARTQWASQRLAELVACESPSNDLAALGGCADLVTEIGYSVLGRKPERLLVDGRPHLLWPARGDRAVLLLGHFDTVWPLGTLTDWPFEIRDGKATGPGVFDMKAGIVQMFLALWTLADDSAVAILLTSDEEIGAPSSRGLIESVARDARAVLVAEPSADGALKTARKGISSYEIEITGRAAHAGLNPEQGINASVEAAHQILAINGLVPPGSATTVTPTMLHSGTTANTVPEQARFSVDVRAWTAAQQRRIDDEVRALQPRLPGAAMRVGGGINRPPLERTASLGLFQLAQAAAIELGLPKLDETAVGGASDGNITAALGVPTLDGLGGVGDGAHARGEHVDLATVPQRAALMAALIERIQESQRQR